jgi:hypothetical protein
VLPKTNKQNQKKQAGKHVILGKKLISRDVAQAVQCLLCKLKAQRSNFSTTKKKKKSYLGLGLLE